MNCEGTSHYPWSPSRRLRCLRITVSQYPEPNRQGRAFPSRPCRVGQFMRARGVYPRRNEVAAVAFDGFQSAGALRGCDSDG